MGIQGLLLRQERAYPYYLPIAVNINAPGARPVVEPNPLDTALAVAAGAQVVLAGLLLGEHAQVLPAAVEHVPVSEDDLVARGRLHGASVQVQMPVLAIDLGVAERENHA